jgi:hypothetical protein
MLHQKVALDLEVVDQADVQNVSKLHFIRPAPTGIPSRCGIGIAEKITRIVNVLTGTPPMAA